MRPLAADTPADHDTLAEAVEATLDYHATAPRPAIVDPFSVRGHHIPRPAAHDDHLVIVVIVVAWPHNSALDDALLHDRRLRKRDGRRGSKARAWPRTRGPPACSGLW